MTVTSTTAISGPYAGNGSTQEFDYDFYIALEEELKVTLADTDGVETIQELDVDYTVNIGSDGTGTFTMTVAPAEGETVTATLDISLTQETDLVNLGPFFAETHEVAFDKLTRICQQQQEELDRCIKVGVSSDLDPADTNLAQWVGSAPVDTDNFDGILSSSDNTVLHALETIDDIAGTITPVLLGEVEESSFTNHVEFGSSSMLNYKRILIEIEKLYPQAASQFLLRLFKTGGSWIESNNYTFMGIEIAFDSSSHYGAGAETSFVIQNSPFIALLDESQALAGHVILTHHYPESEIPRIEFSTNAFINFGTGSHYSWHGYGNLWVAGTFEGVRFFASSGNLKGKIRVWGLPTG